MISRLLLPRRRATIVAALIAVAALTLAACGGSSSGGSSPSTSAAAGGGGAGAAAGGGTGGVAGPGASGQVAAISGTTMQVQSQQAGQVAVAWTSSTAFSQPVATSLSAIKVGDCVVATAPSGSSTSFTATTMSVSTPVNGQCGGAGGGNGARPGGGQRPSGAPSGLPGRTGAFATGTVSSVSGSTLVIAARQLGSSGSTTNRTVTVGSATQITTQQPTTSQSLKVGLCVTAQGTADSTGTVAATSVRISNPVNGACAAGAFGGFGAGNGAGTTGG